MSTRLRLLIIFIFLIDCFVSRAQVKMAAEKRMGINSTNVSKKNGPSFNQH